MAAIKIISSKPWALCGLLLILTTSVRAQSERSLVRDGNKSYEAKKYDQAEIQYRKSLENKKGSLPAQYNLGNALYRQDKLDEARGQFEQAGSRPDASPEERARAFHNLGNSLLKQEKYQESIEAYKKSLRINPGDNDTRYNLAYAQARLQQQQQQNKDNKDNKQQDDKKDQNKEQQKNQEQDKNKEQQQQQQQDQEQNQAKQDQQETGKQKSDRISKEDAEKILQALNNDEKKTQKKLNKKEAVRVRIEKQW